MLWSDILDIAIGLVLVYLIFSLLLTSVCEAIEAMLKTRAGDLERALLQMVQGDPDALEAIYRHPLIAGLYRGTYTARADPDRGSRSFGHLPSYIPREIMAAVMVDLGRQGQVGTALVDIQRLTGFDGVATLRAVEGWYDAAMDRASGWFKRRTQFRLFWLGLGIAITCNVNSVAIGEYLATHPVQRAAAVAMAERVGAQQPAPGDEARLREQLDAIGLPIGWSNANIGRTGENFQGDDAWPILAALMLVFGYLATAFAVMLGSPFWFDLLGKLMTIRSTLKPREDATAQTPAPLIQADIAPINPTVANDGAVG